MLILSRKKNESIVINGDVTISVVEIRGDKVRLGITCPKEYSVHRQEVYEAIHGLLPAPPRATSPEEMAFLQAIMEDPDDEGTRLVFADWLEERGDPRGEFLRLQCQRARSSPHDERWQVLEERERILWAEHGSTWRASFPAALWSFRGLRV